MKKLKYFILSVFLLALCSCEKELERAPLNNLSATTFYKTTSDFEQAVNAAYRALNGYDVRMQELSEVRSDNVYIVGIGPRDYSPIANFDPSIAVNANVQAVWNADYSGISRCNIVLDNLNEQVVPDAAKRARMEGEARFIRAFLYFDLVRFFGKVPLVTKTVSRNEALEIPRSPVEDVYALIISDFQKAATLLPGAYTGVDRGRATSFAANAYLAQVYLTRSGPKLHPDGPCLGLNEYALAIPLLNSIINSTNPKFALPASYASVFSYTNEYNSEVIFDIEALINQAGLGTSLPAQWYEAEYGTAVSVGFAGGVVNDGLKVPSNDLLSTFEPADIRDNFSILPSYVFQGNTRNRPQFVKWLDLANKPTALGNWGINFIAMRYADVLLMKAEAILRSNFSIGTQLEVDALVKQVRDRAGLTGTVLTNVTLDQLLAESRKEFMNEGRRWHELVRTGKVITVMTAWKNTEDQAREKKMLTINNNSILFPIPATERSTNPLLGQNPGY